MKGVWIPKELINIKISWLKRVLMSEISQLEVLKHGCIAENEHFSNKFNVTRQAVSNALNQLEKSNFIIINNAQSKRNRGRKMTVNQKEIDIHNRVSGIHNRVSDVHECVESKDKSSIKNSVKKNICENGFENWYSLYLRKKSKSQALKAWIRDKLHLKERELINTLILQNHNEYSKLELKFVPHPSTYLNQKRYDDEPEINPNGGNNGNNRQRNETNADRKEQAVRDLIGAK